MWVPMNFWKPQSEKFKYINTKMTPLQAAYGALHKSIKLYKKRILSRQWSYTTLSRQWTCTFGSKRDTKLPIRARCPSKVLVSEHQLPCWAGYDATRQLGCLQGRLGGLNRVTAVLMASCHRLGKYERWILKPFYWVSLLHIRLRLYLRICSFY